MTRVDAHHHLRNLAPRSQAWPDPAEMSPIRRDFTFAD